MTRSFFSEEKKEPKKSLSPSAFLTKGLLGSDFFRGIIFRGGTFTSFRRWCCFRASGVYLFLGAPLTLRLLSFAFRDSANGGYLQSGFSPAPCSPLRRLRAYSAELVRAPPYIKVERENCPPDAIGRYSHRCIGRARHKLKRARQLHRIYPASV